MTGSADEALSGTATPGVFDRGDATRGTATLGSDARGIVSTTAPLSPAGWSASRNPPPAVVIAELSGEGVAVAPLLRPSGYHGSLAHRTYRDQTGLRAEGALLVDAVSG